ncbi:CoA transferase [Streptomyces sp. R302]|uniref:CaiB/BaiF CoA transferase family protein n=1 Tax=unclassified Streptomyces TaxID=2593676 RepID=UPI00145DB499|nr:MULTISPECIES: CaiB/BaiF CoA-transferase family protein [unclassified Streptomyces]NML51489.1 CoA transferase [Streptomyces sp. R301]NML80067.1 CoA transferase [Streptomyces sp. R302]
MKTTQTERTGPLAGVRVVELAGIGPGPFAAMLLADLGADVVRVDRPGGPGLGVDPAKDLTNRNKRSVLVDLKAPDGPAAVLDLVERADVLIEGYRPGVAERLGVGPEACLARNPRLVYGRMTGWGQDGPLAPTAGHDIGYIAVTGALGLVGPDPDGPPSIPANLLGDYAGGSLYLVVGVLAALQHARTHGEGQVVDAAIVDGTAHLTTMIHAMLLAGGWQDRRGVNLLDGGCPFYGVYATSDGGHMAVGALEERFYDEFARLLGLAEAGTGAEAGAGAGSDATALRRDLARWPELREAVAARFRSRTRAEWTEVFEGSDACVAPVLSLREAPGHPHLAARATFAEHGGLVQPAPAPRFSATPGTLRTGPALPGADTAEVARDWAVPALHPAQDVPPTQESKTA